MTTYTCRSKRRYLFSDWRLHIHRLIIRKLLSKVSSKTTFSSLFSTLSRSNVQEWHIWVIGHVTPASQVQTTGSTCVFNLQAANCSVYKNVRQKILHHLIMAILLRYFFGSDYDLWIQFFPFRNLLRVKIVRLHQKNTRHYRCLKSQDASGG